MNLNLSSTRIYFTIKTNKLIIPNSYYFNIEIRYNYNIIFILNFKTTLVSLSTLFNISIKIIYFLILIFSIIIFKELNLSFNIKRKNFYRV